MRCSTPACTSLAAERLRLESELQQALESNQLSLAFQPLYQIEPRRLIGFEALMRWEHPERGLIGPGTFIPVAEESGLINQLRTGRSGACASSCARGIKVPFVAQLGVHVNISGKDLTVPRFAAFVRESAARGPECPPRA